jgi:hypothetical protein
MFSSSRISDDGNSKNPVILSSTSLLKLWMKVEYVGQLKEHEIKQDYDEIVLLYN